VATVMEVEGAARETSLEKTQHRGPSACVINHHPGGGATHACHLAVRISPLHTYSSNRRMASLVWRILRIS
jgi:hypothetical protein